MVAVINTAAELASGEWAGHYEQGGAKYPQRMTLEFADGVIRGDGIDTVGSFSLEGGYGEVEGLLRLGWIKTYDGSHSVLYRGTLTADGGISGDWMINSNWSGDRASAR